MHKSEILSKIHTKGYHDPFQVLGVHQDQPEPDRLTFRTIQPQAQHVSVLTGQMKIDLSCDESGILWEGQIDKGLLEFPELNPFDYQYEILYKVGNRLRTNDPYRFQPLMTEDDLYLFNTGTNYSIYNHLGAQLETHEQIAGTVFRVWAPSAVAVSVIGHFNGWDRRVHPMRVLGSSGIWELFIPHIEENELYRFSIVNDDGVVVEKSDPFQFFGENRPQTASIVRNIDRFQWQDHEWQTTKIKESPYQKPLAIYEVHPGSWKRDPGNTDRFLTFRELADQLIPYVKEQGFTHIELMPVMEHPLDESWGYQVTGPFSMSSRYGVPDDFMYFVDNAHRQGIGIILDWVPAHFPKDSHGLARFDGTALYEHEDPRKGEHPDWGTLIYNYGRNEVSNFLIASALFWLDKYHIDGLRVDAVASMLYLDYSKNDGEWVPNAQGGRENLEAIEFIKHMNSIVFDRFPNSLMIAEESTSFYGVSRPADSGGLGFGFKWNMGWMNDILGYFEKDPIYRKFHHNALTFSMMYAHSENFILPISHDEVVHGKKSLLSKMPGDKWQQFANLRLLIFYMYVHPGKKLLFMGCEFGQYVEWNCKQSLDWHLLENDSLHQGISLFVRELNHFYVQFPPLYQNDYSPDGFTWIDTDDADNSVISFIRSAGDQSGDLVCVLNFTPQTIENYRVGLPAPGHYQIIFNSDLDRYGGSSPTSDLYEIVADLQHHARAPYSARLNLPPLGGIILQSINAKETI